MTERQKRIMQVDGKDVSKIERFSRLFLRQMSDEGVGLSEAKVISNQMVCILEEAEKYRPDTPLQEIIEIL